MSTTDSPEAFEVTLEAAEAYEAAFVPAFFAQWAPVVCAAAGVVPGQRVLDVACGTGVVARTAADIVGPALVTGVDLNEAMLTVARRTSPAITWRRGDAQSLPLDDSAVDAVLCQMALMFFPDRLAAVREMARVLAPGGRVAVLVPDDLAVQSAYGPFVEMAAEHAGPEARSLLATYFSCGDHRWLAETLEAAGLSDVTVSGRPGTARFPSVDALVATEVESTPLGQRLSADVLDRVLAGARQVLAPFTGADGALEAPFAAALAVGRRP